MRKRLLILLLLFIGCAHNPESPEIILTLDHNPISMHIGDTWLYRNIFVNTIISGVSPFPDTIVGYSFFAATKDTIISSEKYIIVDGKDYDVEKDSIITLKRRLAIYLGDTIKMFEFNTGTLSLTTGVMKRQAFPLPFNKTNNGTSIGLNKLYSTANYDSGAYYDFVYPMVFPLKIDSVYVLRDTGDSRGNLPTWHRFLGMESVTVPLGTFAAYKYEFAGASTLGMLVMPYYDWIGTNGILKKFLDYGEQEINDEFGRVIGRVRPYQVTELVGRHDIDVSVLKPWGKQPTTH